MKTININGKDYTVEELTSILENAKSVNPMEEVYTFNSTTEKAFEELYKNIPPNIKATAQEEMIVNFYNKSVNPDWNNHNQPKYFPWFYLGDKFRFDIVDDYFHVASTSSRLCFLRKEDCLEAVKKFEHIYKQSRNA